MEVWTPLQTDYVVHLLAVDETQRGGLFLLLDTVAIDIFGTSTVSGLEGSSWISIEFFCQELIYLWTP